MRGKEACTVVVGCTHLLSRDPPTINCRGSEREGRFPRIFPQGWAQKNISPFPSHVCTQKEERQSIQTREKRRRGGGGGGGEVDQVAYFCTPTLALPQRQNHILLSFFFFSFCEISAECTVVVELKEADEEIQNGKMWTETRQLWKQNRRDFTVVKILLFPFYFLCFSTVILWHFAFFFSSCSSSPHRINYGQKIVCGTDVSSKLSARNYMLLSQEREGRRDSFQVIRALFFVISIKAFSSLPRGKLSADQGPELSRPEKNISLMSNFEDFYRLSCQLNMRWCKKISRSKKSCVEATFGLKGKYLLHCLGDPGIL